MLEPVGKKSTRLTLDQKIKCPPIEHPYLYTNKNSFNKTN